MRARRVLLATHLVLGAAAGASTARGQCLDWSSVGGGADNGLSSLAVFDDGGGPALYAGGGFLNIGGVAANRIAKWNGTTWSPLGAGLDADVYTLIVFDDGGGPELYVGGRFTTAGTNPAIEIAKWDGSTWSAVDGGMLGGQNVVYDFAVYDDGGGPALYVSTGSVACVGAGGKVSKLSGGTWVPIGLADDVVSALESHDDGTGSALYAGGYFYSIDNVNAFSIARWDGASWSAVGGGMLQGGGGGFCSEVTALGVFDDGTGAALYAGGDFKQAGTACAFSIARWDGASWSALGLGLHANPNCCSSPPCAANSTPHALKAFDDGSGPGLAVGGTIYGAGGMTAHNAVRWNGTAWSTLGSGTSNVIAALAVFDDGLGGGPDLYAGGFFATAGGVSVNHVARWRGCGGPATHFCPGDGTAAACPCGNSGIVRQGCQNSQSTGGALLQATGATSPDTVKLFASGELPSSATIFLQGNATAAPGVPFGDGLRCATGILKRLYTKNASLGHASAPTGAEISITARSSALGDPIAAGQRRYYQTYYRDGNAAFCPLPTGNSFNASSGLKIVW